MCEVYWELRFRNNRHQVSLGAKLPLLELLDFKQFLGTRNNRTIGTLRHLLHSNVCGLHLTLVFQAVKLLLLLLKKAIQYKMRAKTHHAV